MDLWMARRAAARALEDELHSEAAVLAEVFDAIDSSVSALEDFDSTHSRVMALCLIKARNLGQGCYSLALDALAQEAGALFRPFIEAYELLVYLRVDPSRLDQVMSDRLPSAGKRAQLIDGRFQDVREHLNKHASHVGWSHESMAHLVDLSASRLRIQQQFNIAVLRENLAVLFAVLTMVAIEGVNCVSTAKGLVDNELADRVEDVKARGLTVFDRSSRQAR